MPTVVWSRPALADLDRQYRFLQAQSPEAATRAVQAIIQAGKSLSQSPQRGTPDRFSSRTEKAKGALWEIWLSPLLHRARR